MLPDKGPDSELPWADGALDGVMSHHMAPSSGTRRAEAIATRIAALTEHASEEALRTLEETVAEAPLLECVDDLVSAITRTPGLDADRLHELGVILATRAPDREMVKLGLTLLGLVEGTDDRGILLTLGAHDELSLFAIVALTNRPDLGEGDLWELAKRARGWGRIHAVERLADTRDAEIRAWMLREGFRNSIMDEYLAHVCASTGGLARALAVGDVDDGLLAGASGILRALVDGGPAPGLEAYEDGADAAERFMDLVAARTGAGVFELAWVEAVAALQRFVATERSWDALDATGWSPKRRAHLSAVSATILARPEWREVTEAALDSHHATERWLGEHVASLLGIDTFDRLAARLERDPLDIHTWMGLMPQLHTADRLERAMAMAERLPLADIATGPADELGLGPRFEAHRCLDAIVQDLDHYPGHGWPILRTALRSPVTRNRNVAIRALAAWGRSAWPVDAEDALQQARDEEPTGDVRERIEAVLEGREID